MAVTFTRTLKKTNKNKQKSPWQITNVNQDNMENIKILLRHSTGRVKTHY